MSEGLSLLHLAIGAIALVLAFVAVVESIHSVRLDTHRRFGLALSALVITAAAHYIFAGTAGIHRGAALAPRLAALVLAFLPVAVFFWLRIEAYLDGPGDRFFAGRPGWIAVMPTVAATAGGAILVTAWMSPPPGRDPGGVALRWLGVLPTILVAATSLAIGWSLVRGQQTRRAVLGGWSLSGLVVTMIFPTSAVAYLTQAIIVRPTLATGIVDWLGVPAALWFWRETRRLTGSAERAAHRHTITIPAQRLKRPAPWAASDAG
ncbi:MAG: hypothetical protein WCB04_01375 [Mycobacteriales bacterium]